MKQKIMRRNLCQGKGKGGKGTQGRKGNKGRGGKEIGQERYRCVLGLFRHRNASICLGLSLDPNKTDSSAACDCWSSPELSPIAATVRTSKIKEDIQYNTISLVYSTLYNAVESITIYKYI